MPIFTIASEVGPNWVHITDHEYIVVNGTTTSMSNCGVLGSIDTEANKRAEELLLSCLSKKQRLSYVRFQRFYVKSDGFVFRIRKTVQLIGNIDVFKLPQEEPCLSLCFHLKEGNRGFPIPDHLLAQKLVIENDIGFVYGNANIYDVKSPSLIEREYIE